MEWITGILPGWFVEWFRLYIVPVLRVQVRVMAKALLAGVTDTLLFITLPLVVSFGSQAIWSNRYQLTMAQQTQMEKWGSTSQIIAYMEDVPPVTPLVLWYKENGMREENPGNCEGIMGLYTAVTSGALPCFPPGPISAGEVARQLRMGVQIFKSYCPEISYTTTDPQLIKKCYLHYNAGPRSRMNPNASAYVMNGYDAAHQNMILTDIHGRQYRLTALGAWPTHIAMQAQFSQRRTAAMPPAVLAPTMLIQEAWDKLWTITEKVKQDRASDVVLEAPPVIPGEDASPASCRPPIVQDCFIEPHSDGNDSLRPGLSPLLITPFQHGELMCSMFPGVALVVPKASLVLAPMPGYLTRYSDGRGNLTIQIENDEWTLWLIGLRSYTAGEGVVAAGDTIGAVGGAGSQTPGVHYAVYDKIAAGFVDALSFTPATACPATNR
jgi:hypothetical protein